MLSSPRHFLNTFHISSHRSTNATQTSFTSYAASSTPQDTHRANLSSNSNFKSHSHSRSPHAPASTSAADRDFAPSIYHSIHLRNERGGGGSILQGSVTSHTSKSSLFKNPFKKNNDLLSQLERAERVEKDRERQKERVKKKEKEKEREGGLEGSSRRPGLMRQGTSMIKRRFSITRNDMKAVVTPTPKAGGNEMYGRADEDEEVMVIVGSQDEMRDFHSSTQRLVSPITDDFLKTPSKMGTTSLSPSLGKSKTWSPSPSSTSPQLLPQHTPEDPIDLDIFDSFGPFPNYDTNLGTDAIDAFAVDATPKKAVRSTTWQVKARPKSIYVKRLSKRFGKANDTGASPKHYNGEIHPTLTRPLHAKPLSAESSLQTAPTPAQQASRRIPTKEELMNRPLPLHTPQGLPSRYRPNGTTIFDIYPDEDLDYHPIPPPRTQLTTHLGPNNIPNSTAHLHPRGGMANINTNTNLNPARNTDADTRRRATAPRSSRVFDIPNALYDLWQYGMDEPEIMDLSFDEEELERKRILPMFVHVRSTGKRPVRNTRIQSPDPDTWDQGRKMGKDEFAGSNDEMRNDLTGGPIAMGSNTFKMEISPASLDSGSESSRNSRVSQLSEVSEGSQMSEGAGGSGKSGGSQGSRDGSIALLVYGKVETASKMSLRYATPRAAGRALKEDVRKDGMASSASVMTSSVSQASQLSGVWDYAALIDDPDHASSQNEAPAQGQAQTQTQNQTTSVVHTRSEAKTQGQGQQ
ncbi:hypothetical protein AYX14_05243 [Cryptococcus neoformans]|nr:hypothetical protein AYX14_05243 [Cryptococcus neoformans var. grubii]